MTASERPRWSDDVDQLISDYFKGRTSAIQVLAAIDKTLGKAGVIEKAGWQPIETAKKTQRHRLLGFGTDVWIGYWNGHMWVPCNRPQPTDWMPLPDPPSFTERKQA